MDREDGGALAIVLEMNRLAEESLRAQRLRDSLPDQPEAFIMNRYPEKGSDVLYHDPVSGEACPAKVTKVMDHHGGGMPFVNLVFWTEEGASDKARAVAHGPGEMGRYWFAGETSGPGKPGGD